MGFQDMMKQMFLRIAAGGNRTGGMGNLVEQQ